jgi:hypothetical protein
VADSLNAALWQLAAQQCITSDPTGAIDATGAIPTGATGAMGAIPARATGAVPNDAIGAIPSDASGAIPNDANQGGAIPSNGHANGGPVPTARLQRW